MTHEELIQGYFKNSLTEREKLRFDQLLNENSDFKTAYEDYENMHFAFLENEKQVLKSHLQNLENEKMPSANEWYQIPWLRYATASILVIGLCYMFLIKDSNNLYEDYFDIYPNVEQPIIRGTETTITYEAFKAYENGNFKEASSIFKELLKTQQNSNYRFYYAMSLMNEGNYSLANSELSALESLDFDYKNETLWYSSLIALKLKDYPKAISYLELLQKENSNFKSEEIKSLIQKLKKKL